MVCARYSDLITRRLSHRIAFIGAGGIGGYFGRRLANKGEDVTFNTRGAHLKAMQTEGLRIERPEPFHVEYFSATDDPAKIGMIDIVIFSVELWDTDEALKQIRPMVASKWRSASGVTRRH